MKKHVLTGFGFGPIQGGLFVKEAFESGDFSRIVVAEIDGALVEAVRSNKGSFHVNVADKNGIEEVKVENVEMLNPGIDSERELLRKALAESTEVADILLEMRLSGVAKQAYTML